MNAMPVVLVGLTALITSAMVQAGFALWWVAQYHVFRVDAPYDWAAALTVSGTATTVALIVGLVARRLVVGNTQPADREKAAPARFASARLALPKF